MTGFSSSIWGATYTLIQLPNPLLAPPESRRRKTLRSSEAPCYGGSGPPPLEAETNWHVPGEAAVVLTPTSQEET
jgi:maltooligosyltrehalose trehalohydrolase